MRCEEKIWIKEFSGQQYDNYHRCIYTRKHKRCRVILVDGSHRTWVAGQQEAPEVSNV